MTDHVALIEEPVIEEEQDSKMESFSRNTGDLPNGGGDKDTWEDPMTCCGCIPIKCGMVILAIGSYLDAIPNIAQGLQTRTLQADMAKEYCNIGINN